MKKCLAIILALVMALGCMSVAAFAAGSPDLSMLVTGAKIQFGTQSGSPVEWVIGGDGKTGMTVPTGCIALVTSGVVASGVVFDDDSNVYANSNLKTVVENAVTFTTDEQAAIKERTLAGNQTYGSDCDGVAGDTVTAAVWAPTTKDAYELYDAELSAVGSDYWLCSPGDDEGIAAFVYAFGLVHKDGSHVDDVSGVRAGLYLDTSYISGITAVSGAENTYTLKFTAPSSFLTSITLTKDYDDRYNSGEKSTAISETVTYTITPISTGNDVPAFTNNTFSMTVTDGVGSADITLPETITKAGEFWYSVQETGGKTAGVAYDTTTYYLHLVTDYKDGEYGILSAQVHKTAPSSDGTYTNEATDKITGFTNSYAEGSLKICQETFVDGSHNDYDAFTATVTFTLPEGKEITGSITYGDKTIAPEDWTNGSVSVTVDLKDSESVEFTGIPDGVTYTVEQTEGNEDKGYELDSVAYDTADTGDSVSDAKVATGTIGDAEDVLTITNSMETATDVGVIVEYTAFVLLALAAVAAGAWLVISRRRKAIDAE